MHNLFYVQKVIPMTSNMLSKFHAEKTVQLEV